MVEFGPEEVGEGEEAARAERDDWGREIWGGAAEQKERDYWRRKEKRGVGRSSGGRRPRKAAKQEEEEGDEGGGRRDYRGPFPPHGSEGLGMVGTREKRAEGSSPRGNWRGENLREDISVESSRTSPHVRHRVGRRWARMGPVATGTASWRKRRRGRVVGCGGGVHPQVPSGGAHPLFLTGGGEEQQGEEGGEGGHPLFVPGEGDEQGKGQGRGEKGRGRIGGRGIPIGRPRRQKSEK